MHTDEAVHAIKFGALLEDNHYRYDPVEYHGPTLNYFSLIPAWLSSASSIKQVNEKTLRIIPVIFGLITILFLLMLVKQLGWGTIIVAALFTAISPAMVFYSRYYIQEMLLVCFSFGVIVFGYRYYKNPSNKWAILTGISVGLMHATKETSIISFAAIFIAFILVQLFQSPHQIWKNLQSTFEKKWNLIIFLVTALLVSILFYSSFFTNLQGVIDSILTYKNYFSKAGQHSFHIYPWYYYLSLLTFFGNSEGAFWSEGFVLLLALIGVVLFFSRRQNFKNKNLIQFFIIYTVIVMIIYSLIPYKTPWILLNFYPGFIILSAIGFTSILNIAKNPKLKFLICSGLLIGIVHLFWQSYQLNFKYFDSPANPYVYSHPGNDVVEITTKLEKIAEIHPEGHEIFIQVISPGSDYWPLPWYLRNFDNIGWWDYVDEKIPSAPIILAAPIVENDLLRKLYELPPPGKKNLYVPLFEHYRELRPGVEIRAYVTSEIWNLMQLRDVNF